MNTNTNPATMTAADFRDAFRPTHDGTGSVACHFGRSPEARFAYHYGATHFATVTPEDDTWVARWSAAEVEVFASRARAFAWLRKQARAAGLEVNRTANAFINAM